VNGGLPRYGRDGLPRTIACDPRSADDRRVARRAAGGCSFRVGLLIAGVAVKEGVEAWRGEGCCVSSPLDGIGFVDDACEDDCCAPAARQSS
jgi:hypothetical protein